MSLRTTSFIVVPGRTPLADQTRALADERGCPCLELPALAGAIGVIDAHAPAVVLVDVARAPDATTEMLTEISRHAGLVLVGPTEGVRRLAQWCGADDFLMERELSDITLDRAIEHVIDLRKGKRLLSHLLGHDPVTGGKHAAAFRADLASAVMRATLRPNGRVGLLLVNLDRFDVVNETFGYDAGDAILREAVLRMTRAPGLDLVARLDADTMAATFDERTSRDEIVKRVRDALEQTYTVDRQEILMTASMAVAEFPGDAREADTLLRAASSAMKRAKHVGRNNVQIVTSSLTPPAVSTKSRERFTLERDLRRAVDRGELLLHYQPQLDLHTGDVLGVEALVRWMRPGVGMVSPAEFVPLLEDTGLILPASDWIFTTACQQIAEWTKEGLAPLRVAVNVSATQIRQQRLLSGVRRALDASGIAPELLELELTEGLLIENKDTAGATLDTLREMGASISLDDFGTGYSSLSYLKRLPIDVVKIDRSFLQEVPKVQTDSAITSAIITLAHELGHRVVAEGVESIAQLEFLEAHGCDAVQGFYFSRPLAADRCLEWLRAHTGKRAGSGTYATADAKPHAAMGKVG